MTTPERVKEEYLTQTRILLGNHPDALQSFEQLWQSSKMREAYLNVDQSIQRLCLKRSVEQKKIDESFYWEFVN